MHPEGLVYREDFITADEERELLAEFEAVEFRPVTMRGQTVRRTVRHYGLPYDRERGDLVPAEPLPESMLWLRDSCAALIERDPDDLAQVLVSRYPEGAGIGWHRDAPMFGSRIAAIELAPRSAYLLSGKARWSWQHSIPATKDLRYSVTFRTLKR